MGDKGCDCLLCKPIPGKRAHPRYGYDLDKVKDSPCLMCKEPIGDEEYYEYTPLARFGSMMFIHRKCDPKIKNEKEAQHG